MISSRAGDGLSVNTLIIVALGIIVLVLSTLLYYNFYGGGSDTIGACENQGGTCMQECTEGMFENHLGRNCYDQDLRCCMGN